MIVIPNLTGNSFYEPLVVACGSVFQSHYIAFLKIPNTSIINLMFNIYVFKHSCSMPFDLFLIPEMY